VWLACSPHRSPDRGRSALALWAQNQGLVPRLDVEGRATQPGLLKFPAGNAPDRIGSDARYVNGRLGVDYGANAAT